MAQPLVECEVRLHLYTKAILLSLVIALSGCVETSIQPLSQSSFKVSAESECGAKTTREIAFRSAAIEVIKRGADRFIVLGDQSGSKITGGQFTSYGGFIAYDNNTQDMVIQIVKAGDRGYSDALSAKDTLGPDWKNIVAKEASKTCL
jgi:hypothetical protein